MTGLMYVTRERKVCFLLHPECVPHRTCRCPCTVIRVHCLALGAFKFIHLPRTSFPAATNSSSAYHCCDHAGLDTTMDLLEELHTWLAWIEGWVQGDGACELEIICKLRRACPFHPLSCLFSPD